MKVAVTAMGPGINAAFSPTFGRAPYFVIVDVNGENVSEVKSIPNPGASAPRSAGVMAAQALINEGVSAVISGSFGPNAHAILSQAGIGMYGCSGGTVLDVARAFGAGNCGPAVVGGYGPGAGFGRGYGRGFGRGGGRGRGRGWGRGPW